MAHFKAFGRFLLEYGGLALKAHRLPNNTLFLQAAYRAFLKREIDAEGLRYYLHALEQKHLSKPSVLRSIIRSNEFIQIHNPTLAADVLFLRDAYYALLQREPSGEELAYYLHALQEKRATRRIILSSIIQSTEFQQVYEQSVANNMAFLQDVYHALLKREPDKNGLDHYLQRLQRNSITKRDILSSIIQSDEFRQIDGLPIHPADAAHQSRMILFQQCLPRAEVIVDLGGAAHDCPQGALLVMGYPHHPREIMIVDLPPTDRIGGAEHAERAQEIVTDDGIHVSYLYRSMADLSPIADESVDLVVSGESIEHVTEADADAVCREVYRILKPGGYFCLDTPNAALTRLQSPDELIHPEHKKEYYVDELKAKLERWGFEIVEAKAICPMPQSLASGVFDFREMTHNIGLSENPEEGYMFYFKAIKPAPSH